MMTQPSPQTQKFMFARSFEVAKSGQAESKPKAPTYSQADLDAAKAAAHQEGVAAGKLAANQEIAASIAAIMQNIDQHIETLLQGAEARRLEQQQETMDIALSIAQKLLPDFCARQGLEEIQGLLTQIMREMAQEPRLVVRVNDAMLDPLQQSLDELIARQAFTGKIILLADNEVAPQDCRIAWSDGGIERNAATIWQIVERLSGRNLPMITEPPPQEEAISTTFSDPEPVSMDETPTETVSPSPEPAIDTPAPEENAP